MDSGLLLFLTQFQQHPVIIKNRDGGVVNTDKLDNNAVIVIIASALPNWLLNNKKSSSKFFPAPHAVPSLSQDLPYRTVLARMKVVPDSAVPVSNHHHGHHGTHGSHGVKFEEYFAGKTSSDTVSEELGLCPLSSTPELLPESLPLQQQWSQLKKTECDTNKAYCWMNCLELPADADTCGQVECLNIGHKQCCTDTVTENCANMDPTCRWQCTPDNMTAHSGHHMASGQVHQTRLEEDDKFCNGDGTDMFMQGFQVNNLMVGCMFETHENMKIFLSSISRQVETVRMSVSFSCLTVGS